MKKQKKYLGISIIAFLFIFSSLMTIFDIFRKLNKLTLINIISSSSSLYLFVAYLICGLGLIKRKLWAKYICIFLSLWYFMINLPLVYITMGVTKILLTCFSIISLVVVYYLTRPYINEIFEK